MRQHVVALLAVLGLSLPLLATNACDFSTCWDPAPECEHHGGHIERDTCTCVPAHHSSPYYPPSPGCSSDASCPAPLHCMDDGTCANVCVTNADCRRGATCGEGGLCARACKTASDCSAGFACDLGACAWRSDRCSYDNDYTCPNGMKCESRYGGECGALCGSEQCKPRFECVTLPTGNGQACEAPDYRRCATSSDCNTERGAACIEGKCYGPRIHVVDAGSPDGDARDASDAAIDGDANDDLDASDDAEAAP